MISQRFYYAVKPFVPLPTRRWVRRILANRTRATSSEKWPIAESAGDRPSDWTGWPNGKKFAVVLTHDVEGVEGLAKHRKLAELEMEYGFRSSFNFVPEGDYSVTPEQREYLTKSGFEVGVHDLHHNGKLFHSRRKFERDAKRINQYVKEWGASGFRAGFMLRNLDWFHGLDIAYDASTFDTDPFEPQPDGVNTIFPFWRPRPEGKDRGTSSEASFAFGNHGYVELAYTIPQDSTLFLVLKEKTPEIWLRKTDWLAQRGGMVLINVHPDYIQFDGEAESSRTYPLAHYRQFLEHLRTHFAGQYWQALPREVAAWYAENKFPAMSGNREKTPSPPSSVPSKPSGEKTSLTGKRAAVLLYSLYPFDPRPRRAAEAMIEAGMEVDLLCLSEKEDDPREEIVRGVRVFRAPLKRMRGSKKAYILQYTRFLVSSFWFLFRRGVWSKYDIVHVHNMPDILVFSAWMAKLRGARVILDLHDPMPELMMTIYGLKESSSAVRMLKRMEKWSTGFANLVITVNVACKKIFSARSCRDSKVNVIMNSPDEGIFKYRTPVTSPSTLTKSETPFVIMYHGSIVERHGLDLAVDALKIVRQSVPQAVLWILGSETAFLRQVMTAVESSGLKDAVRYFGSKKLEEIVEAIGKSDVGVIPNRRSIFTELNTPTRIFEYLSQGKPIIAPRAPGILDYFEADELVYFEMGSAEDLAKSILWVRQNPELVNETVQRGQRVYQEHMWSNEKHQFIRMVTNLLTDAAHQPVQVALAK